MKKIIGLALVLAMLCSFAAALADSGATPFDIPLTLHENDGKDWYAGDENGALLALLLFTDLKNAGGITESEYQEILGNTTCFGNVAGGTTLLLGFTAARNYSIYFDATSGRAQYSSEPNQFGPDQWRMNWDVLGMMAKDSRHANAKTDVLRLQDLLFR